MKSARILSAKRIAAFVVSICLSAAAGPITAKTSGDTHSREAPSSSIVATVNNASITQADVDIAVAASGERDTAVLRRAIKHRLIALELLRQAAGQGHYMSSSSASQRASQAESTVVSIQLYLRDAVRPAPVTDGDVRARYRLMIGGWRSPTQDLRNGAGSVAQTSQDDRCPAESGQPDGEAFKESLSLSTGAMHPEFFMHDILMTRTPWRNMHGLVGFDAITSTQTPGLEALFCCIRRQLEAERLNEAISAVVENLMAGSNISE